MRKKIMPTKPAIASPAPPVQLELNLFGHIRPMVFVREVAEKFCVNDDQVRVWVDEGWLMKVGVSAETSRQRQHYRIVRCSADALYVFRIERDNGIAPPYRLNAEAGWWLDRCREFCRLGKRLRG